jgi:hypothetical protein
MDILMSSTKNIIEDHVLNELERVGGLLDSPNRVIERLLEFWWQHHKSPPGQTGMKPIIPSVPATAFDPFSPPSLRHTKLTGAILAGTELPSPSWNGLVDAIVRLARQRLGSFIALKNAAGVNMVEGKKVDQGYRFLSDINISVQGQDAQDAWRCVAQLANVLKVGVEVYFFWRRNPGAYLPGETATLTVSGRS